MPDFTFAAPHISFQATAAPFQRAAPFSPLSPIEPCVACNLNAFSERQRACHNALLTTLNLLVKDVRELDNGYEIAFPPDAATAASVVEFATLERLCCPFLTFTIQLAPESALLLRMTGPDGAKAVLSEFVWVSEKRLCASTS